MKKFVIELKCKKNINSDLSFIGISSSQKGYQYLCESILIAIKQPKLLKSIKLLILPKVAKTFDVKVESIDRAMRHSLESAYFKNTLKNINKLIGFDYLSPYEKPSLTHFISLLAEHNMIAYNKMTKENKNNLLKNKQKLFIPGLIKNLINA